MAFHRSISRTFWEYEMNLKTLLIVSSILLGAYTVSARPSQQAVKLLNRLQLLSDEVKLKKTSIKQARNVMSVLYLRNRKYVTRIYQVL